MKRSVHANNANLTLVSQAHTLQQHEKVYQTKTLAEVKAALPGILQITLELEKLFELFQEQLQLVLQFDSLHYQHQQTNCTIDTSTACHHRCHYNLDFNHQHLGEITLTRRIKFAEHEIEILEDILSQLFYPLRNCLMYRQAVMSSLRDPLTGLGNRTVFDNHLQRELELARRQNTPLSLIVLDIDNFKDINDNFGHQSGDNALKLMADTIKHCLRGTDIACRFGGEEFTLTLSNTDIESAWLVAERVRKTVSQQKCVTETDEFGFTISIGVAQLQPTETADSLFDRADKAMYQAKQQGKNQTIQAR